MLHKGEVMKRIIILGLLCVMAVIGMAETPEKPQSVVGQQRTFYLKDNTNFYGKVVAVMEDGSYKLDTGEGILIIPKEDILEETVKILKKDGSVLRGRMIGEDEVYVTIQNDYGVIRTNKADVENMDRYYGGKLERYLQKKTFFAGEEQNTTLFSDPTAFVLPPYTFYIAGFSMGYGFTDRMHLFTSLRHDFNADLNLTSRFILMQRHLGAKKSNLALEASLFSNHDMNREYARYYEENQLKEIDSDGGLDAIKELYGKNKEFYWKASLIYSIRSPLKSGRGNWSLHFGGTVDKLAFEEAVTSGVSADGDNVNLSGGFGKNSFHAYRLYAGMDYDLSRKIKFISEVFYDPGNHYQSFGKSIEGYFENDFLPDYSQGERKEFDLDFGITYAANNSLRIGFHFQQPYITLYWKFMDY